MYKQPLIIFIILRNSNCRLIIILCENLSTLTCFQTQFINQWSVRYKKDLPWHYYNEAYGHLVSHFYSIEKTIFISTNDISTLSILLLLLYSAICVHLRTYPSSISLHTSLSSVVVTHAFPAIFLISLHRLDIDLPCFHLHPMVFILRLCCTSSLGINYLTSLRSEDTDVEKKKKYIYIQICM